MGYIDLRSFSIEGSMLESTMLLVNTSPENVFLVLFSFSVIHNENLMHVLTKIPVYFITLMYGQVFMCSLLLMINEFTF